MSDVPCLSSLCTYAEPMQRFSGVAHCVLNLQQNPQHRPVLNKYMPTLLKGGLMWIIRTSEDTPVASDARVLEERPLLPKECCRCPLARPFCECCLLRNALCFAIPASRLPHAGASGFDGAANVGGSCAPEVHCGVSAFRLATQLQPSQGAGWECNLTASPGLGHWL